MFNILEKFRPEMVEGFRKMKHRYLVSQTYREGIDHFDNNLKEPLLLTDYNDFNLARVHYNAVKKDKYAAIIDLEKDEHRQKVMGLLRSESKYIVYSAFVNNVQKIKERADFKFDASIRRYITKNTNWRIGSDKTINPQLQLIFGELFVIIKYAGQQLRIKLADLERT